MRRTALGLCSAASIAFSALLPQCGSPEGKPARSHRLETENEPSGAVAAWEVVYAVLQHPRCANCHPQGDAPLQGDDGRVHAQNVLRGRDGQGLYALRCDACHWTQNAGPAPLPPGAPNWHLPTKDAPLVFVGRSSGDLCRQLKDPERNGGKTPEQLCEHMAHDPLVKWGWDPGEGRAPVSTPHPDVVRAMRAWVDGGCACP